MNSKDLQIYNGTEAIPFNSKGVLISLDATSDSDLDWQQKKKEALLAKEKGFNILWNLELGLFDQLQYSLDHEVQFQNICLGIDYFLEFTKPFQEDSLGVILYDGTADFSKVLNQKGYSQEGFDQWKDKHDLEGEFFPFYARDVISHFFHLITDRLGETFVPYLFFEMDGKDELYVSQLLHPDLFRRFRLLFDSVIPDTILNCSEEMVIFHFKRTSFEKENIAVCLPSSDCLKDMGLQQVFSWLRENKVGYRIISETWLTSDWEGVDVLFFPFEAVNGSSLRKLRGFCAAGGKVVMVGGETVGLAEEVSFKDYIQYSITDDLK